VPEWQPLLIAALGWLLVVAVVGAASSATHLVVTRHADRIRAGLAAYPEAAALAFFTAMAIAHTWPLAANPAGFSRNDNGDALLNEWALAWFAHQAPRNPLQLFEANIFYPEPHTLAYSEAMIVQSALAAPILWLGGSPVLAFNLMLIGGFALTGWAVWYVMRRWTGDWGAALIAGLLFGFNAHTLTRMPHLQAQHVEFLPLALLAFDALLRQPGLRNALRLALWFTLQALASIYLLVFSAFALVAAALARPQWYTSRPVFRRVAPQLAVAAAASGAALLPYLLPYWLLSRDRYFTRSLKDTALYSATWTDYLAAPGRLHFDWWSAQFWTGDGLFPGVVALALAGIALLSGVAFRDGRARMCLVAAAVGMYFSFGVRAPGYATLYELLPMLQAIRAPVRFGQVTLLGVAVLAGFGMIELRRRLPARTWTPVAAALLGIVTLETRVAPLAFTPFNGVRSIYSRVRHIPDAVVVELPLPGAVHLNAQAVLNSTAHFQPMLNGYSGFAPRSYYEHVEQLDSFPDAESMTALRSLGVTHAFVHTVSFTTEQIKWLERNGGVQPLAVEETVRLYALAPADLQ
jgi:hypothetical protein